MSTEIIPVTSQAIASTANDDPLPVLVERAGGAARFAWDEFFLPSITTRTRRKPIGSKRSLSVHFSTKRSLSVHFSTP